MSEFDKDTGGHTVIPQADETHPDHEPEVTVEVNDDLEPDDVQDEEELEGLDDLDLDSVDVDNVPVLEEGADD